MCRATLCATSKERKVRISNGAPPNDVSFSVAGSGSISKRKSASAGEDFGVLRKSVQVSAFHNTNGCFCFGQPVLSKGYSLLPLCDLCTTSSRPYRRIRVLQNQLHLCLYEYFTAFLRVFYVVFGDMV